MSAPIRPFAQLVATKSLGLTMANFRYVYLQVGTHAYYESFALIHFTSVSAR